MSFIEDLFSLNGKNAIVTGAARGNGKAIADGLENARVAVFRFDILSGHDIIHCDMTKDIAPIIKIIENNKIDILINNVGVTYPSEPPYPIDKWEKTFKINLDATFKISVEVAEKMKKQKSGSIINITSLGCKLSFPNNPAYMASKGALMQLGKSLAYDYGKYGIRVNNIAPGYIKTDMTKKTWKNNRKEINSHTILGRWGTPSDLIGTVIFLCSDASSYITGQDIFVDGGWNIKGL